MVADSETSSGQYQSHPLHFKTWKSTYLCNFEPETETPKLHWSVFELENEKT